MLLLNGTSLNRLVQFFVFQKPSSGHNYRHVKSKALQKMSLHDTDFVCIAKKKTKRKRAANWHFPTTLQRKRPCPPGPKWQRPFRVRIMRLIINWHWGRALANSPLMYPGCFCCNRPLSRNSRRLQDSIRLHRYGGSVLALVGWRGEARSKWRQDGTKVFRDSSSDAGGFYDSARGFVLHWLQMFNTVIMPPRTALLRKTSGDDGKMRNSRAKMSDRAVTSNGDNGRRKKGIISH